MAPSIFQMNCTIPESIANYVSSPDARGTLDILWSCLAIIFLCTWSIQYLNVPLMSKPHSLRQHLYCLCTDISAKVFCMILTALCPEWSFSSAIADWSFVRRLESGYKSKAVEDDVEWTRAHIHLANLGGFILKVPDSCDGGIQDISELKYDPKHHSEKIKSTEGDPTDGCLATSVFEVSNSNTREKTPLPPSEEKRGPPAIQLEVGTTDIESDSARKGIEDDVSSRNDHEDANRRRFQSTESITDPFTTSDSSLTLDPPGKYNEAWVEASRRGDSKEGSPGWRTIKRVLNVGWHRSILEGYPGYVAELSGKRGDIEWSPNVHNVNLIKQLFRHYKVESLAYDDGLKWKVWISNVLALQGNMWYLDARQLLCAREIGLIKTLPSVSSKEIDGRSTNDTLAKVLALWQILSLIVGLLEREVNSLPTSQMEIVTLAFAAVALCIYMTSWDKPQGVQMPLYIKMDRPPTARDCDLIARAAPKDFHRHVLWIALVPNPHTEGIGKAFTSFCGIVCAVLFGAIHLASWNFEFPTHVEQILWRASACIMVGVPIMVGIPYMIVFSVDSLDRSIRTARGLRRLRNALVINSYLTPPVALYVAARLFILVEAFRTLCFLPPNTYVATPSINLPQLG